MLQQARGDGDQRRIFERARGEGIRLALVDRHFRHADAGTVRQLAHGVHQPEFGRVGGLLDDARTGRPLGHRFAHQERDDRAGKADHQRKHGQRADIDPLRAHRPPDPEQVQDDRQHQHNRKVGGEE